MRLLQRILHVAVLFAFFSAAAFPNSLEVSLPVSTVTVESGSFSYQLIAKIEFAVADPSDVQITSLEPSLVTTPGIEISDLELWNTESFERIGGPLAACAGATCEFTGLDYILAAGTVDTFGLMANVSSPLGGEISVTLPDGSVNGIELRDNVAFRVGATSAAPEPSTLYLLLGVLLLYPLKKPLKEHL